MKHYWLSAVALIGLLTTAQAQPAPNAQTNAVAAAPFEWGPGVKVLIVGGGWAHDYDTWDNKFDTAVLQKAGIPSTHYTEDPAVAASELPHVDVLLLSNNKRYFATPPFRQAFSNFVGAGKGLVLLHSGTFYSWPWDEFYATVVGSGAHDHDGASQFDETIIKDHPVTHGLPATFKITDELYHIVPIPGASPMEVLAEASRPGGQKYPSVWLVHYAHARIVCIALGHDGYPRRSPEFSTLLANAVHWAGGQ
jgi:type 1 glutamine amidotransferase